MTRKEKKIRLGKRAIFLPRRLNANDPRLYMVWKVSPTYLSHSPFRVERVTAEQVLTAFNKGPQNSYDFFFETLQGACCDHYGYYHKGENTYNNMLDKFYEADFVESVDGNLDDAMQFVVNWAKGE